MTELRAVAAGPAVVVCVTCGGTSDNADGARPAGAVLADRLRAAQAADPALQAVAVQEMRCLFACAAPCAVHLRAPNKIGYLLGRFEPDDAAADAILRYAAHHAASAIGEVAFADWPAGVLGHFLARLPPPGFLVD